MTDKPIPRAPYKFSEDTFKKLLDLHEAQPWVLQRQKALMQLLKLCPEDHETQLIIELLHRFSYYTMQEAADDSRNLALQAVEDFSLNHGDTIFCGLSDESYSSSGQVVLNWIRDPLARLGWSKHQFFTGVQHAVHKLVEGGTLVFVDDFVGSGRTLSRKRGWLKDKTKELGLQHCRVGLIAIAAMRFAETEIANCVDWSLIGEKLAKGISEHYTASQLSAAIATMKSIESRLATKAGNLRLPRFGYQQSETLYTVEQTSVPNNNFPVFWWPKLIDGSDRETLLTRV